MASDGFLSFEAARTFARTLKLGSKKEWNEYSKSGKRPSNIPGAPRQMYSDAGWVSWPDWMGYALSFEAARAFARTLTLGGEREWREYSKSGKRPSHIPSSPWKTYLDAGWVSFPDWLGYEKKKMTRGDALPFEGTEGI